MLEIENNSDFEDVVYLAEEIVKEETVEYVDQDDDSKDNSSDKEMDEPEILTCNMCGIEMPRSNVHQHMKDEHYKFKCSRCEKKYYTEAQLREHLRSAHLKSLNLKCPFCPVVLTKKYTYRLHVIAHSSTAQFTCTFENCGKSFKHLNTLKMHVRKHENRHRRECPVCHEHVTQLATHVLTHSKYRPYICDECGRGYLTKRHLIDHKTTHVAEGHKCKVCHKTYKSCSSLQNHMRAIHSGRTYECSDCGKIYNRHYSMISHLKRMHGEAAYAAYRSKAGKRRSKSDGD